MSKYNNEYGMPNELPRDSNILDDVERIAQLEFDLGEKYQKELMELNELAIQKQALQNANLPHHSKTHRDAQIKISNIEVKMEERYANLESKSAKTSEKSKVKIPDITSRIGDAIPTIKRKDKITDAERTNISKWLYTAMGSALLIWGANFAYSSFNYKEIPQDSISYEQLLKMDSGDVFRYGEYKLEDNSLSENHYIATVSFLKAAENSGTEYADQKQILEKARQNFEKNKDSSYLKIIDVKIDRLVNSLEMQWLDEDGYTPQAEIRSKGKTIFQKESDASSEKELQFRKKEEADLLSKYKFYNGVDYVYKVHKKWDE